MTKIPSLLLLLLVVAQLLVGCSNAFTGLAVPKVATRLQVSNTHIDRSFTADSGMTVDQISFFIKNLNHDNFDETLEMLEPLLMNECRGDTCGLFLEDIKLIANELGKQIPEGYATLRP